MKIQKTAALLAAMLIALSGCSDFTIGSSSQDTPQKETTEEQPVSKPDKPNKKEETPEKELDRHRIQTELEGSGVFVEHWQEWDREKLPAQYMMPVDETVLRLIEQVRNVSPTERIQPFDGTEHANTNDLMKIAVRNTPALHFDVQLDRDEKGKIIADSANFPNHVLTLLLQNEQEQGRNIQDFYYQEDVAAVYSRLFGSALTLQFQDLCPKYYYYAREGVFARKGEEEINNIWPMLVQYEETDKFVTVDLLLTGKNQEDKPLCYLKSDGSTVELTADNYRTHLAGEPVYRYTFKKIDDELALNGIRQVGVLDKSCQKVRDIKVPVSKKGPQLKRPERLTVTSGSIQDQIDLKKEYEGVTADEYLLNLLEESKRVDDLYSGKVIAGSGCDALTLTLGYNEGEEKAVTVLSNGYIPGIEDGYLVFGIGSEQYILSQERYEDLKDCIESCKIIKK